MSDPDDDAESPLTDEAESPLGPIKDHEHDMQRAGVLTHDELGTETRKMVCRDPECEYKKWEYRTNEQQSLGAYGDDPT